MIKRVIWIITDSAGIGALPDAAKFGDVGTNTIEHVYEKCQGLKIDNLIKMGLGNIEGVKIIPKEEHPIACYAKSGEISNGKDTTIGHWEMIGIHSPVAFPTYEEGFPKSIIDEFIAKCNKAGFSFTDILGNKAASGTEIIKEYGECHMKTGMPIIYTSADSVFQIACHEEVYSPDELYKLCEIARAILKDEHCVARVIARPFISNAEGGFDRTSNRRDFSKQPSDNNLLTYLSNDGHNVIGIGKIEDIFAGKGITYAIHTKDNEDGINKTIELMGEYDKGLIFTNLVDFDSKWGHRNDYVGYGRGLEYLDMRLPDIMKAMTEEDLLIINSDHGCDPTTKGTDHTREYIPILVYSKEGKAGINLGVLETFADIGQTIAEIFGTKKLDIGTSFLGEII